MDSLARALEAWREALGPEYVLTDEATISAAETATFSTSQRIPGIIRPGSREEVQECVRVANEHKTPIYPVSTGKNWGYGSRVPPQSGSVLMELYRLTGSPTTTRSWPTSPSSLRLRSSRSTSFCAREGPT